MNKDKIFVDGKWKEYDDISVRNGVAICRNFEDGNIVKQIEYSNFKIKRIPKNNKIVPTKYIKFKDSKKKWMKFETPVGERPSCVKERMED